MAVKCKVLPFEGIREGKTDVFGVWKEYIVRLVKSCLSSKCEWLGVPLRLLGVCGFFKEMSMLFSCLVSSSKKDLQQPDSLLCLEKSFEGVYFLIILFISKALMS